MENDDGASSSSANPPWIFDNDLDDSYRHLHHPVFPTQASSTVIVDFRISGKDTSESCNAKRKIESLFCVMRKRNRRNNFDDDDDDMDEGVIVDDCFSSGSDTDMDLIGELKVLSSASASLKEVWFIDDPQICSGHSDEPFEDDLWCSVNTEDSEIPCNFDIFKIDDERSSATQVRYGDVVNMPLSMEETSSSDEVIRLWHRDYPIPICIVPPDDESNIMLETCSLQQIGSCGNELILWNKEYDPIPICVVPPDDGSNIDICSLRQIVSCGNELRRWNKDDDPIPISIVPPDDGPNVLRETCPLYRIVSCRNDDKIDLEMSTIPLTKTLEGPSRPWTACGSLAAGRNLPLMGDNSGACSSMDDQLYEDGDVLLVQTPSNLYQDEVDGEDEICFSEIDAMIRKLNLLPDDSDSCLNREEWNMSKHPTHTLRELENCTRTSMRRAIMSQRAIAILHCPYSKHYIKKPKVIIGRSSGGMNVDIDLGKNGHGSKISRRQALLKLDNYGSFSLKNLGKRHIYVNGEKLDTGQIVTLTLCSSIDIRGIVFMFKINKEAVRRFLKNKNTRRNNKDDTKFKWCE